jgi:hypothetical protein
MTLGGRETVAAAGFLCRSIGRIVGCLKGLTEEEGQWKPTAPGTNSLCALAWHTMANAEENVLGTLCGGDVPREGEAEFDDAALSVEAVQVRWRELEPRLRDGLAELNPARLSGEVTHPRRGTLSGFEVLVVALRHAAEHMGQAELTRDLVVAARGKR